MFVTRQLGCSYWALEYQGHGASSPNFLECTLSTWCGRRAGRGGAGRGLHWGVGRKVSHGGAAVVQAGGAAARQRSVAGERSLRVGTSALPLCSLAARLPRPANHACHRRATAGLPVSPQLPRLDDVLQLLDAVGGERQVLVGSSLGAWLALHAALRRPHLVKVGERLGWAAGQVALQLQAAAALAPACDLALRPDPCR